MKKRILVGLLMTAMLCFVLMGTASAADETSGKCGDNLSWTLTENGGGYTLTISGSGAMEDYKNPTGGSVEDAEKAPWYKALEADEETGLVPITEIVIGSEVTGLGDYAFAYTSVEKANFVSNVTDYGDALYYKCTKITTVDWSDFCPSEISDGWVTERTQSGCYVPFSMFDQCENLNVCIIDGYTFGTGVLALPENITGICTAAFRNTAFSTIDFSSNGLDQITVVGPYVFSKTNVTTVTIPGNVEFYLQNEGNAANTFYGCSNLISVTFDDSIASIPSGMFNGCTELTTVNINKESSAITEIEKYAFANCSALKNFTFPAGLEEIGIYAFVSSGLTSVSLGTVKTIGDYSFFGCASLKEVEIIGTTELNISSTVFNTTSGYPAAAPIEKFTLENGTLASFSSVAVDALEELYFGDGVTSIPACVYGQYSDPDKQTGWYNTGAKNLKTVTLGNSITSIPNNAFLNAAITEIEIPDSVKSIGNNAFNGCEELKTVTIGKDSLLETIGGAAFGGTSIESIYIPANVTSIGQQAFFNSGTLKTVDMSDVVSAGITIGPWCFTYDSSFVGDKPTRVFYVSNAEVIDRLNTPNGIQFEVTGLSPIAVGWVAPASSSGSSNLPVAATTYSITMENETKNGTITLSDTEACEGDEVTITVTPDRYYALDSLIVTNSKGRELTVTDNGDGTYTFTMPASKVTIEATFEMDEDFLLFLEILAGAAAANTQTSFIEGYTDLDASAWYAEAVNYVVEQGLMTGTSATTFEPNTVTNRAMLVTILYRLEGEPAVTGTSGFTDVVDGAWYADAVTWAAQNGIVNGLGDGQYGVYNTLTREQMAAILYRYAQYKGYDVSAGASTNILSYTDAQEIGEWAMEAMQWANGAGLITGVTESTLAPQSDSTRAVMATIFMRFCENVAK